MLRPEMDTEKQAQAAAAAVDTRELVSLLQQMVRIRSYSAGGEEGTIARFMRDYLAKLGLEVELQEVQPDRSLVKRSHTQIVEKLPATYTINVGGDDHPLAGEQVE